MQTALRIINVVKKWLELCSEDFDDSLLQGVLKRFRAAVTALPPQLAVWSAHLEELLVSVHYSLLWDWANAS
jgi:hypothetical protein